MAPANAPSDVLQNFLQYQNIAAQTVRAALKEPARKQAAVRDIVNFRVRNWADGARQAPYLSQSITAMPTKPSA